MADARPTATPARQGPQHRDHGAHRRGQDHDDRAHPLLHRQELQDRRGPRGRRHHGLDGPGAGARHHHHLRRHHLLLARTTGSTSSTPRATSTSPSRWSARCACSTAPSRCSTPWPASSPRPRRSGARPTSTTSRASASSTRWTASAPTSTAAVDMIRDRLDANAGRHPAAHRRRGRLPGRRRPGRDEGARLATTGKGEKSYEDVEIPDELAAEAAEAAPPAGRRAVATTTTPSWRSTSATRRSPPTTCAGPCARATIASQIVPGPVRHRPSRTRASSPCSTPSSTTCPARSTCPPTQGTEPCKGRGSSSASPTTTSPSRPWPSRS